MKARVDGNTAAGITLTALRLLPVLMQSGSGLSRCKAWDPACKRGGRSRFVPGHCFQTARMCWCVWQGSWRCKQASHLLCTCLPTPMLYAPHMQIVEDALEDKRFAENPLVVGDPHIRFYAGAPLISSANGYRYGTVRWCWCSCSCCHCCSVCRICQCPASLLPASSRLGCPFTAVSFWVYLGRPLPCSCA